VGAVNVGVERGDSSVEGVAYEALRRQVIAFVRTILAPVIDAAKLRAMRMQADRAVRTALNRSNRCSGSSKGYAPHGAVDS